MDLMRNEPKRISRLWRWRIRNRNQFVAATDVIFSEDEMALLSGIIAFWFGSRQWGKK